MYKKVDFVLKAREKNIGEETILQSLPHKDFRFANPFIVIHHLPRHHYPPGSAAERLHPHPHRGFAPVTFMFRGEGFHKDSEGNSGVLRAGEAQWMFAGSGLLHSEGPTNKLLQKGGDWEFVQIWINVPAEHKWDKPYYQQTKKGEMPLLFSDEGIDLRLASGSYQNMKGPIRSFTPVIAAFGSVQQNKTFKLFAREGDWTLLYLLEGKMSINNEQEVSGQHLVIFNKAGTEINITTKEEITLVFLSAEPINEPIAAKGNIVMNTQQEVEQAEKDYAEGKFGSLDF